MRNSKSMMCKRIYCFFIAQNEYEIKKLNRYKKIVALRDKNYKITKAIKEAEKRIEDKTKLIDQAEKYLKEHLGESKTLNVSQWKSEVTALKKEKDSLYYQIIDLRKEVEQAESVRSCIEKLQQENRELTQVKKQELDL